MSTIWIQTQLTVAKKSYNLVSNWQSVKGDLQPLWNSKTTGAPAAKPQKNGVRRSKIKPAWKPGGSEQQRTSPASLPVYRWRTTSFLCTQTGPFILPWRCRQNSTTEHLGKLNCARARRVCLPLGFHKFHFKFNCCNGRNAVFSQNWHHKPK